jgi:hypothetical protein
VSKKDDLTLWDVVALGSKSVAMFTGISLCLGLGILAIIFFGLWDAMGQTFQKSIVSFSLFDISTLCGGCSVLLFGAGVGRIIGADWMHNAERLFKNTEAWAQQQVGIETRGFRCVWLASMKNVRRIVSSRP